MFPVVVRARHSLFSPSTTAYTAAAASKRQHKGQATSEGTVSLQQQQQQQQSVAVRKTSPAAAAVAAVESNKVPTSFNVLYSVRHNLNSIIWRSLVVQ
jgi:hypothetical protein